MTSPNARSKNLSARGTKANLDTALAAGDLFEGELVYARDEKVYYQVESSTLVKVSLEEAVSDNLPYVRYNGTWVDLEAALAIIAGQADVIDGGDADQVLSSTDNSVTYDGGNADTQATVAIDSAIAEGGLAEPELDTLIDGGLATV
jgi:hypothetical protein